MGAYRVEPVFGWLFGACEYWLGEPLDLVAIGYLKWDMQQWIRGCFGTDDFVSVLRDSEEDCELWIIEQLLYRVTEVN